MIKEEYKRNINMSTGVGCGELCTLYRVHVVRQVSTEVGCGELCTLYRVLVVRQVTAGASALSAQPTEQLPRTRRKRSPVATVPQATSVAARAEKRVAKDFEMTRWSRIPVAS